jgi:hypothetical protein
MEAAARDVVGLLLPRALHGDKYLRSLAAHKDGCACLPLPQHVPPCC